MSTAKRNVAERRDSTTSPSIGEYLLARLQHYRIADVFGIPGDYILSFYALLEASPINAIGCTREDCAGFAADAYARVHGMGALCVTYCVGGLSVCNSIAGAYAEKSPVVMITGSPGLRERHRNPLLHHMVRDFRTQYDVFRNLCVAAVEIEDPATAFRDIDRALAACDRYKRPVYIEIPRDMVHVRPDVPPLPPPITPPSDPRALAEAVAEAAARIETARQPVLLLGVEIHRFGLQDAALALAEQAKLPIATTMLGKGCVEETHPLYMGLYAGGVGRQEIARYVEASDCVVMLGTFMTDINLGIYTAELDGGDCIYATSEELRIRHHHFHEVRLDDFINGLAARGLNRHKPQPPAPTSWSLTPFELAAAPIRISRLIERLNQQLDEKTIVIADVGDALFASTELTTHNRTEFLAPAYYTSMGFAIPAALGAQTARPEARVVAIVGDGAFQRTGMELSTIVQRKLPVIVIVLNNGGYGTERLLHPGEFRFNDIPTWRYERLPEVLGGGRGYDVHTEADFDAAITAAWNDRTAPSLLHIHLDEKDCSQALARLAAMMQKTVVER